MSIIAIGYRNSQDYFRSPRRERKRGKAEPVKPKVARDQLFPLTGVICKSDGRPIDCEMEFESGFISKAEQILVRETA